MNKIISGIALGLLFIMLSACSSAPQRLQISSEVDALATNEAQSKRRFVILPGNKDINPQDLQFMEFKGYVEKSLLNRGFIKVEQMQDGDAVLFLNYGTGEPQLRQYSYDVPVMNNFGYYPYYRPYRYYPSMTYGYTQHTETYAVYKRYLTLEAYDMAAYLQQKTPIQLWKVSVQSQGQSNDLRLIFPYMVTAMQPYLGTNTGHMLTVKVDETNLLLKDISTGNPNRLPAPSPMPLP
ncbi:MAG: hypothetical protein M0R33_04365 [Methylomonas sp.]|jgi:hypothetical protein|uniref:hypothetical protein n=1 Tax=Methylomonas sp. TaxID=418 RepID=UPI0025EBC3D0|nr:hypothetical protein [Methylomonas sp.]MCK9605669.1 hypothetical protein [Methylomonas sp.]